MLFELPNVHLGLLELPNQIMRRLYPVPLIRVVVGKHTGDDASKLLQRQREKTGMLSTSCGHIHLPRGRSEKHPPYLIAPRARHQDFHCLFAQIRAQVVAWIECDARHCSSTRVTKARELLFPPPPPHPTPSFGARPRPHAQMVASPRLTRKRVWVPKRSRRKDFIAA